MTGAREERKLRRREHIAATALELFARRGFDAVSVAEVARAAGVTEKTVFNHFPTKEDLVYPSDRTFEDQLLGALRARAAGVSVLNAVASFLLDLYATFPTDRARQRRHRMLSQIVSASAALQNRERLILARYSDLLQHQIATEQSAADDDLRPRLAAGVLMATHGAVIAAFRTRALHGQPPEVVGPAVVRSAQQILQTLADGLGDYARREASG
jgi:AcrR family transcriptional regulator